MAKTFSLSVLFKVVDDATKPIRGVGKALSKLSGPIGKIKKGFIAMGSKVKATLSGLANIVKKVALGVVAMTAAAVASIVKFTSMADRIGKVADKLGISTDQLQAWRFAAEQSGLEASALDNAIRFMNKGLGEAKTGTGLAFEALKQLRIGLTDSSGKAKTNAELFNEMADKISKVKDPMKQADLASKLFGRSGADLINMFKKGSKGLEEFKQELIKEGGLIPEDTIRNSEAFQDSINRLKKTITGLLATAFGPLIPRLNEMLGMVQRWIRANRELINTKIRQYIMNIIEVGKGFVIGFKDIWNTVQQVVYGLDQLIPRSEGAANAFDDFKETGIILAKILKPVIVGIVTLIKLAGMLIEAWKPVKEFFGGIKDTIGGVFNAIPNFFKKGSVDIGAKGLESAKQISGKSETDINIKVTSDNGAGALIEDVKKKKGNSKVKVASTGYLGLTHAMAGAM